jgi:hypothetical protein
MIQDLVSHPERNDQPPQDMLPAQASSETRRRDREFLRDYGQRFLRCDAGLDKAPANNLIAPEEYK